MASPDFDGDGMKNKMLVRGPWGRGGMAGPAKHVTTVLITREVLRAIIILIVVLSGGATALTSLARWWP